MTRPACIVHAPTAPRTDSTYPSSEERLSFGVSLGALTGFKRLGVHYEVLPPGRRTSWPHAESTEEEGCYVISGAPSLWLDGVLHALGPGDFVGFEPGTGVAHTVLNDSDEDAVLLVFGEHKRTDNLVTYPMHPARNAEMGDRFWRAAPNRELGPHDGTPRRRSTVR